MKKTIFVAATLFLTLSLSAQNDTLQIDQQVWHPFIQSYQAYDTEAFMAVHTPDIIRVNRSNKSIKTAEMYRESQLASALRNEKQRTNRTIDLRFLERIISDDHAFEVGYYKVDYNRPSKSQTTFYGKFHVLLKKQDGRWQIAMDADIGLPESFSEADFLAAQPLHQQKD